MEFFVACLSVLSWSVCVVYLHHVRPSLSLLCVLVSVVGLSTAVGMWSNHVLRVGDATGLIAVYIVGSWVLGNNISCIYMSPVAWILQVVQSAGPGRPRHFCKCLTHALIQTKWVRSDELFFTFRKNSSSGTTLTFFCVCLFFWETLHLNF